MASEKTIHLVAAQQAGVLLAVYVQPGAMVPEGETVPEVPYQTTWQPDSHLASTWIADHRNTVDQSCVGCHDAQTFCDNPNCHERPWPYVDLSHATP